MIFEGNSFEEIAAASKQHGIKMFQMGDKAHLDAMRKMKETAATPEAFQKWFQAKREQFNALPEE